MESWTAAACMCVSSTGGQLEKRNEFHTVQKTFPLLIVTPLDSMLRCPYFAAQWGLKYNTGVAVFHAFALPESLATKHHRPSVHIQQRKRAGCGNKSEMLHDQSRINHANPFLPPPFSRSSFTTSPGFWPDWDTPAVLAPAPMFIGWIPFSPKVQYCRRLIF